jgi:hypothetical protein
MRIIIAPFTNGTAQSDQIVRVFELCHRSHHTPNREKMQLSEPNYSIIVKVGRKGRFSNLKRILPYYLYGSSR